MIQSAYPLVAVVAMGRNRVIGVGRGLPWRLPDDLKRVKSLTMGRPLVMGRRTFDSLGRPLPGRANIVLTRSRGYSAKGAMVAHDAEAALAMASEWIREEADRVGEVIVFGGGEVYRAFLDRTDRIEMTEVDDLPDGDTTFPELDAAQWRETGRETVPPEGGTPGYAFVRLERRPGQPGPVDPTGS